VSAGDYGQRYWLIALLARSLFPPISLSKGGGLPKLRIDGALPPLIALPCSDTPTPAEPDQAS